jgi:hypothetical protein
MAGYSAKAQPFLDALGAAVMVSPSVRNWLIAGTRHEAAYRDATSLHLEQAQARGGTKQPFFCNYWCGHRIDGREKCACSVPGSNAKETDALFLFQEGGGRKLAVHVEFKHPSEQLKPGQAETYPRRAECWATGRYRPRSLPEHNDWITVILAEDGRLHEPELAWFERRIGHSQAASMIPGWPG